MKEEPAVWDYLIVTASNDAQARAYESQLKLRQRRGHLPRVRHVLVVADPEGRRVGSGGSTICCLMEVVNRELATARQPAGVQAHVNPDGTPANTPRGQGRLRSSPSRAGSVVFGPATGPVDEGDELARALRPLRRLRVLIIHAGGDSRRLPAYGPCGKIFIPIPGAGDPALGFALFDRIAPAFLGLPPGRQGSGQVVIAAGDALVLFDPSNVSLDHPGLTALACRDTPEHARKHGVFCGGADGRVRLYLQKPSPAEQRQLGAVGRDGQALLDIGMMSFDSTLAEALLRGFGIRPDGRGQLVWPAARKREVLARGVDFFREICCAMGADATPAHHCRQAKAAGSRWSADRLGEIFAALAGVPFHLQTVPHARFLHFGTTRQLITSGLALRQHDQGGAPSTGAAQPEQCAPVRRQKGADAFVAAAAKFRTRRGRRHARSATRPPRGHRRVGGRLSPPRPAPAGRRERSHRRGGGAAAGVAGGACLDVLRGANPCRQDGVVCPLLRPGRRLQGQPRRRRHVLRTAVAGVALRRRRNPGGRLGPRRLRRSTESVGGPRLSGRNAARQLSAMALDVRSGSRHAGAEAGVFGCRPLQRGGNRRPGRSGPFLRPPPPAAALEPSYRVGVPPSRPIGSNPARRSGGLKPADCGFRSMPQRLGRH